MDPDAAGDISMLYSTIYATMSFYCLNMGRQHLPFTQATALVTFEFSSSFRMDISLSTSFCIGSCFLQDVHVQEKKSKSRSKDEMNPDSWFTSRKGATHLFDDI